MRKLLCFLGIMGLRLRILQPSTHLPFPADALQAGCKEGCAGAPQAKEFLLGESGGLGK